MGKARWYGNVINRIQEDRPSVTPEVGMGGTVFHYTDRSAVTVTRIISKTRIAVTDDKTTKWSADGSGYGEEFETVPGAQEKILRLCRDGKWKFEGDPARTVVALGRREAYYDRSF